ncbi:hypothetical protein CO661_13975 [Sinorhizobium fredii]|uniref:Uncharacterized protein n=1 Tax=Rhizobium fredii TaxID=380 RepID=A0A2A6LY18_RHIFR|nr:hypothetical protein [Sinorhizobium fredii]PDT47285.1 hypothetical protein CO661_13975 [Sinorhizobium fredii]
MSKIEVKALEWTPWTGSAAYSYSPIGDYSVDRDEDEDMASTPYVAWGQDDNLCHHATLEAAKAAAQSDFDARIRSALVERKAEPVAWRWRLRGAQVWIYDPSSEWLDKHCADQGVEIEPLYSTLPAVPTPTPAMIEAAWQAYQDCPVDLCGDHDEEQKKSVVAALCAAFSASPSPVDSRDALETERARLWRENRELRASLDVEKAVADCALREKEALVKALETFGSHLALTGTPQQIDRWNETVGAALAAKEQQP